MCDRICTGLSFEYLGNALSSYWHMAQPWINATFPTFMNDWLMQPIANHLCAWWQMMFILDRVGKNSWVFDQGMVVHSVCDTFSRDEIMVHVLRLPLTSTLHCPKKGVFDSLYHSQVTSVSALSLRFVTLTLCPFMCCISLKSPHTTSAPGYTPTTKISNAV